MSGIEYRGDELFCDGVRLADVAQRCGTPTYVYSASAILEKLAALRRALEPQPHRICYAVKTNSNLAVLGTLVRADAGFDIVSGGELHRLLCVGADPQSIVFAGVGKTGEEMRASLRAGIGFFNVESVPEAELLSRTAREMQRTARVALRVNPGLEAGAHHYVSTGMATEKFGIPRQQAVEVYEHLARLPGLEPLGLHCHIGSQVLDAAAYRNAAEQLSRLVRELRARGLSVEVLNLGGGLGIRYGHEVPLQPETLAEAVLPVVQDLGVRLFLEPGRYLVGNAGALLCRVLYRKETGQKTFLVVDAGMNDLVRPSLYGAHHALLPVERRRERPRCVFDVVGPICESGDFLARGRELERLDAGELLAVDSAGAYGFVMSSNYNSRTRAAEVLVRGDEFRLVRQRESWDDLVRGESDWRSEDSRGAESPTPKL